MKNNRLEECTKLSEEILTDFELSRIPVGNIVLKCSRLCRLLGDDDGMLLFRFESGGYPRSEEGNLTPEALRISELAGRRTWAEKNGERVKVTNVSLIAELEESVSIHKIKLQTSNDPNISVSSANPNQVLYYPAGNRRERMEIVSAINTNMSKILKYKGNLHQYILEVFNRLKYGNVVEDVFTRNRLLVNERLVKICPDAIAKFVSVYDNMDSQNDEDWANAVHSCRRILKDVADNLYPPSSESVEVKGKKIDLGEEKYINRLIQFIENNSNSKTYSSVVGKTLNNIGERIDAINNAVCKGTHVKVSRQEAERYIVYTYLLLGDIISLSNPVE